VDDPPYDDATLSFSATALAHGQRGYVLVLDAGTSSLVPVPPQGVLLVGRAKEAQIQTSDAACSRRHAELVSDGDTLVVRDLGSHNGTRVNGSVVDRTQLVRSGDVVSIGDLVMVVHAAAPPARPRNRLLDERAFRERLDDELQRAIAYERAVAVAAIRIGDGDRSALAGVVDAELRAIDAAWVADERHALVLLPELDGDAAGESIRRLVARLSADARAGVASCPVDGSRSESLVWAARDAAAQADAGTVVIAIDHVRRLELGGRGTILADPAMAHLFELVRRLADSDVPVLVVGETGVGKENAAQALHAWSRRAGKPLVAINCAALQESLVESELFGHERGAFSGAVATKIGQFETADGGTVFLDEIGELPPQAQSKLLRALDTKRVTRIGGTDERAIDVRFVAATNRDLEREVAAGRFRQDLYYRLRGAKLALPPLRDRPREIAVLARSFLEEACTARDQPVMALSAAAMDALVRYAWPGNVRELKNEMQYVAATADGVVVEPWHLTETIVAISSPLEPVAAPPATPARPLRPLADEIRELERRRMAEALAAAGGVQKRAAELIAMPLRTFRMKAKQHGLSR
jgi:two-component system, NtrC family, response regulator AtoC